MGERVLRDPEALNAHAPVVGVSAGTAAVLGLRLLRQEDAPTTAYLMVGDRCSQNCAFCAQARGSSARPHYLSRVVWPQHPLEQTLEAVNRSFEQGRIVRCCLQVTASPGYWDRTLGIVHQLRHLSPVPVCASVALGNLDSVQELLQSGVERVSLALDAACERVFQEAKHDGWENRIELLWTAARRFPGRVGTHLIAGLGETEREMSAMLQELAQRGVTVGLFSFTPVAGTLWAKRAPPLLTSYRRIQAALYLLSNSACRVQGWTFSETGRIVSYGLSRQRLHELLSDGRAFQTAGCPGCNRPYYNERPGSVPYNYPRMLQPEEIEAAISAVLLELVDE